MKIYIIKNLKTKEITKVSEKNKNGMAMLFNTALSNWETKGSQEWKKYCAKYTTVSEYDKHLEVLEEKERKEFFSNLVENNNNYNPFYKIIKVKELDKERV